MNIIFHDMHSDTEASESLASIIKLFKEQYNIKQFKEIELSLTLVDDEGYDVELVDSNSSEVYRRFDVYKHGHAIERPDGQPLLQLVVDNSKTSKK